MTSDDFQGLSVILIILLFLSGIYLGFNKKIVIYNDYSDVAISFMASIFIGLLILAYQGDNSNAKSLLTIVDIVLLVIIFNNAKKSNDNVFKSFYAVLVKIPLSLISFFLIMSLLGNNSEKSEQEKKKELKNKLVSLGILAIISIGLVQNQNWKGDNFKINTPK